MKFGKIEKESSEILLSEWKSIIASHSALEQSPDRTGINPFTKEEVLFPSQGVAFYNEDAKREGNITLQEGVLLTTGVPLSVCDEIAALLGASVKQDDRS